MAQRAGTAIHVELVVRDAQFAHRCHRHHGKGLVDFEQIDLVQRPAGLLQQGVDGADRGGGEPLRFLRMGGMADDARQRLQAACRGIFFGQQDHGSGAIGNAGGTGGGHAAVLLEGRAQGRDLGDVRTAGLLVAGDLDVTLAGGDLHRNDLVGEGAVGLGCLCALDRLDGVGVLLFAGELVLVHGAFGKFAHGLAVVGVDQAVVGHVVHGLEVAETVAGARVGQQMRGVGHRFHATGDHDLGRAGLDQVMTEHDGLHARTTDLVEGGRADRQRDAGGDRCLAGRGLAEVGRQHAAHQDFGDVAGRNARLFQRGGDGGRAEGRGRNAVELAEEGADGSALGGGDDDVGHGNLVDA
ncbi:hypothetical protein D3C72_833200 [compost metagenome]